MTDDPSAATEERPLDVTEHRPAIQIGWLYRRAAQTYAERFPVVAGIAVAVFAPLAVITTFIARWGEDYNQKHSDSLGLVVSLSTLVGTSVIVLGSAFYAGLLDKVVGEHQHGHHRMTVREVARTLPYRRLIAVDLLLSVVVTVGLLLFVVPGLILFSLFALVGPVVTIEGQTVLGAFRRSAHLIRPVFLTAFVAVTLPVALEHALIHQIEHYVLHKPPVFTGFVLNGLAGATVGAFVGLVEVTLAFALVHRERGAPSH